METTARNQNKGCGLLLLLALLSTLASARAADDRPNILFILADDLAWNAPGCYGNKDVPTPHLDRLAAQGMRFTQAYADAQCSPTRAAFLSGQYGARTGLFEVIMNAAGRPMVSPPRAYLRPPEPALALSPEVGNLAGALRAAGYATGLSGKWHVADGYAAAPLREREGGRYFDRYGFDFCGAADESRQREDKAVDAITNDIIGFIERNRAKPWFAFVSHFTPHTRLAAPAALVEKHVARGYRRSSSPTGKFSERPSADYLAMLEHLDTNVGRLLQRLDELQLAPRTLVIFTSDNGGMSTVSSSLPLREGKGSPYEGGIRVPLIARWPGRIAPKSECRVPVHTVDYYPTFLELARSAAPAGRQLDGRSFVPLLTATGNGSARDLFWHLPTYNVPYGRAPSAVIRRGEWKLIRWIGDCLDTKGLTPDDRPYGRLVVGARSELYNLSEDSGETRDLAATFPEKAAELQAALEAWWRDTGARMPEKNPNYDPAEWWR
jgi:arylsulfatase A-like enzyme